MGGGREGRRRALHEDQHADKGHTRLRMISVGSCRGVLKAGVTSGS